MEVFDFFRKPEADQPVNPSSTAVQFDEDAVTCTRPNGQTERVRWSELRAVLIQTTAVNPASDDLFWVLVGRETRCIVPNEAQGSGHLLERLQKLPGFDNKAVILACQCTEEQSFLCWKRAEAT